MVIVSEWALLSYDTIGFSGGNSGHASFASNFLILPFVSLGTNELLSATLKFDAAQNIIIVDHFETTNQTAMNATSFDTGTGKLTIPAVDFQGATYRAILNQVPGTLNFSLETAEIQ